MGQFVFYIVTAICVIKIIHLISQKTKKIITPTPSKSKAGRTGEKSVKKVLKKLSPEVYHVYNDVLLEMNNKTTQIDHLVISEYGIFVIETKNYKGIIRAEKDNTVWFQRINNTKEREIGNPTRQNSGHIRFLKTMFKIRDDSVFKSIITFSRTANVQVRSFDHDICYYDNLINNIEKYYVKRISKSDVEKYCRYIENKNITSRDARRNHIKYVNLIKQKEEYQNNSV